MRERALAPVVVFAWSFAVGPLAHADQTARLVYSRAGGASACPDETALVAAVAARLGYDPFRPLAPLTVVASVTRAAGTYRGDMRLVNEMGDEVGSRSIEPGSERCEEVVAALALTISVAIDPLLLVRPGPPRAPAAASKPAPPAAPPPAPPEPPAPRPPPPPGVAPSTSGSPAVGSYPRFVTASVVVVTGSAPATSFGVVAGTGVRVGRFSVAGELRADAPSPGADETLASVSSFLLLASVVPCVHVSLAFGCVFGSAGLITATASGAEAQAGRGVYVAVGPRLGAELPVSARFGVRATVDLGVPLRRYDFDLGGTSTYTTFPVWGAVGVGGAYHF